MIIFTNPRTNLRTNSLCRINLCANNQIQEVPAVPFLWLFWIVQTPKDGSPHVFRGVT